LSIAVFTSFVLLYIQLTIDGNHWISRQCHKCGIDEENRRRLTRFCQERGVAIVRTRPYNPGVTETMVAGMPVVEFSEWAVSGAIKEIWASIE